METQELWEEAETLTWECWINLAALYCLRNGAKERPPWLTERLLWESQKAFLTYLNCHRKELDFVFHELGRRYSS